jgi:hypothetical protein
MALEKIPPLIGKYFLRFFTSSKVRSISIHFRRNLLPLDGGGKGWGWTNQFQSPLPFTLLDKVLYSALLFRKHSI